MPRGPAPTTHHPPPQGIDSTRPQMELAKDPDDPTHPGPDSYIALVQVVDTVDIRDDEANTDNTRSIVPNSKVRVPTKTQRGDGAFEHLQRCDTATAHGHEMVFY